jgi:hypothetical protein
MLSIHSSVDDAVWLQWFLIKISMGGSASISSLGISLSEAGVEGLNLA